jgi:hypothetical protein
VVGHESIKNVREVRVCDSRRAPGYRASQKYLCEAILAYQKRFLKLCEISGLYEKLEIFQNWEGSRCYLDFLLKCRCPKNGTADEERKDKRRSECFQKT